MARIALVLALASLSLVSCQSPLDGSQPGTSTSSTDGNGSSANDQTSSPSTTLGSSTNTDGQNLMNSLNGAGPMSNTAVNGSNTAVNGSSTSVNGSAPSFNGSTTSFNGSTTSFNGSTTSFNGSTTSVNGSSTADNGSKTSTLPTVSFNGSSQNTSMFSEVYTLDQNIEWVKSDFNVYNQNGTVAYLISNQVAGSNATKTDLVVKDGTSGEQKVRLDTNNGWCGFGKTYTADDGISFTINPRMFLPDQWIIRQNNSTYVYKRYPMSLNGGIMEQKSNHLVVQISVDRTKSSEGKKEKRIVLSSDGSIPGWDLVAFIAVVRNRVRACGY